VRGLGHHQYHYLELKPECNLIPAALVCLLSDPTALRGRRGRGGEKRDERKSFERDVLSQRAIQPQLSP